MSFEEFCEVISSISNVPLEKIKADSSFRDELDIDSLQMVNLIVEITSKTGVEINSIQSKEDLLTVGKLYKSIFGR